MKLIFILSRFFNQALSTRIKSRNEKRKQHLTFEILLTYVLPVIFFSSIKSDSAYTGDIINIINKQTIPSLFIYFVKQFFKSLKK